MALHLYIVFFFVLQVFNFAAVKGFTADLNFHPNMKLLPNYSQCGIGRKVLPCSTQHPFQVRGGRCNAEPGAFPWMARLSIGIETQKGEYGVFNCGGSIINNRYVLTAAHCFDYFKIHRCTATIGGDDNVYNWVPGNHKVIDSEEIVIHEQYNKNTTQNDIALVRLSQRITMSEFARPICLPFNYGNYGDMFMAHIPTGGTEMTIAGWGDVYEDIPSNTLKYEEVPVTPVETCVKKWENRTNWFADPSSHSTVICAGDYRSTCKGDSGGPLMKEFTMPGGLIRYFAFGITSWGQRCHIFHNSDLPAVSTKIHSFLPWILDKIKV